MKSPGVIFDFDGVIINSVNVQKKAFYQSYQKHVGIGNPPFKEFLGHSGNSLTNIFRIMKLPEEMIETYIQVSTQNMGEIVLYSGIKKLIRQLGRNEITCCLLTGKESKRTHQLLRMFGLYEEFKAIVCSDQLQHSKPHQEGILYCLDHCNLDPERTVMVGDAVNDMLCAQNADVTGIAVTWGETGYEELNRVKPDYIVNSRKELLQIIEMACGAKKIAEVG